MIILDFCLKPLFLNALQRRVAQREHDGLAEIKNLRDLPGGPAVKSLPCNAGDVGLIPGQGTKIPHATEQLSPHASTREPAYHKLWSPCTLKPMSHNYRAHEPWGLCATTREEKTHTS